MRQPGDSAATDFPALFSDQPAEERIKSYYSTKSGGSMTHCKLQQFLTLR
jgi:hypothetical protein